MTVTYADAEKLIVGFLVAQFPTARVCTELPATLPALTIQVERIAGVDSVLSLDEPILDIEVYAVDRVTANAVANQVRASLRYAAAGYTAEGATIAAVRTVVGPGWRPYANTNVRRVGATYAITLHNHS